MRNFLADIAWFVFCLAWAGAFIAMAWVGGQP